MSAKYALSSVAIVVLFAVGHARVAEAAEETPVIELSARPAPAPEPALKHRLLPGLLDRTPGNAALLYDTALLLISEKRNADKLDKARNWLNTPLEELPRDEVRGTLESLSKVVQFVELAARREGCDWQLPLRSEGITLLLPRLAKFRDLGRLIALKARLEIADGQHDQAVHTIQTGFAMARHISRTPLLIHGLVGTAIARVMAKRVEELIQARDSPNLYWALTSLPRPLVDMRQALEREMRYLHVMCPRLREAETSQLTPDEWRLLLRDLVDLAQRAGVGSPVAKDMSALGLAAMTYGGAKSYLVSQGHTPEEVEAMPVAQVVVTYMLQTYNHLRDEHLKWSYVPYWQAHGGIRRADEQTAAAAKRAEGFPIAMMMPVLGRLYFKEVQLDRHIAILRCVGAVRLYAAAHDGALPDALSDVAEVPIPIDPVTGEQFSYAVVGGKAVLYGAPPPGGSPRDGLQYEVTLLK